MTTSPCAGCPPFNSACGERTPVESFTTGDQDDDRSWIVQKDYDTGVVSTFPGLSVSAPLDAPTDQDQIGTTVPLGDLTRTFYSVPIPAGAVEARLHGQVHAVNVSGPSLTNVAWEIVRGTWGESPPASIDPGGVVLASGVADFPSAAPQATENDFDTGRFTVTGPHFQLYVRFVTPPQEPLGQYGLSLRNGSYSFDGDLFTYAWALDFFDCRTTPLENQPVRDEFVATGDGVTTVFATAFPYIAETLEVTSSGLSSDVDSTDPSTGQFTLSSPPPIGAPVRATYRAQGA